MTDKILRYGMCGFESGVVPMEDGAYVDADDYDALRVERDALKADIDRRIRADENIRKRWKEYAEELKADAERYRWLREFIDQSPQAIEHLTCSDGDLIDDVIDAERAK